MCNRRRNGRKYKTNSPTKKKMTSETITSITENISQSSICASIFLYRYVRHTRFFRLISLGSKQKINCVLVQCQLGPVDGLLVSMENCCKYETVKWDWNIFCRLPVVSTHRRIYCVHLSYFTHSGEESVNAWLNCVHTILSFIYFYNGLCHRISSKNKQKEEKKERKERAPAHSSRWKNEFVQKG